MDNILTEMESSGFNRIADTKRMRTEWEKMQADSFLYPLLNADGILRTIGAYMMWKENGQ